MGRSSRQAKVKWLVRDSQSFMNPWETSNVEFPHVLAILLVSTHPREGKTYVHTQSRVRMLRALFVLTKKWPSTHKGKNKCGDPYAGVLLRNEELLRATTSLLSTFMPSERSQAAQTTHGKIVRFWEMFPVGKSMKV